MVKLCKWQVGTSSDARLSPCGTSRAEVAEAMNTNSPTDVSWWGFSGSIVYASIFFHLLMQAIEVGEHFQGTSAKRFLWEWDLLKMEQFKAQSSLGPQAV